MTAPVPSPEPVVAGDGGVLARLRRRTVVGAGVLLGVTLLVAVTAIGWPGWALGSVVGLVIAAVPVAAGLVLSARATRRAAIWSAAAAADPQAGAVPAVIGPPKPLNPVRPGQPIRRRLPAQVLPIRADLESLRGGVALVVHARRDRAKLGASDEVDVVAVRSTGPYLVHRRRDGAVFVAERSMLAAL